ncbi:hypothetical protein A8950_1106 [Dongia mobilis]|uniref:2-oxoglutarate-Fe(II)-dependent oxygenase superfamily protein n=1 Tax=Dongia mobilis TaxID=578943 RepID=A0A4R6WVS2_9PROT|nr:hypothetical protein [Dongia mobilis]TDQ84549.1 hypothetical protein A8950_1106 [Dongia mobilis]
MTAAGAVPREFEDLLTREGRRILSGAADFCGALADPRRRFLRLEGMVAAGRAEKLRRALETGLLPHLETMAMPIPPETIWEMQHDYEEWLPKTARVRTAYLERKRSAAYRAAAEIGLIDLLTSESLAVFAENIAGRKLDRKNGQQALCYGPGDYAGPHNDHHPENARAASGYLDLHLSLSSKAVDHQYLVYAKGGHFTEMLPVHGLGTLTIYRLPFWHYTTPLLARPEQEAKARRWVLLATYLYAREKKSA